MTWTSSEAAPVNWDSLGGPTAIRQVTPGDANDLAGWVAGNREVLAQVLCESGAVLFRGFAIDSAERLERLAAAFCPDLEPYTERRSPRTSLGGSVYTSTVHPSDQLIHFHSEVSYARQWPRWLFFGCLQPATWGGRTPIADCRKVLASVDPRVRERFLRDGVLYVSNYHEGLGLSWQEAFQTDRRDVVEAYCRRHAIQYEWLGGDRLRTSARRHAVIRHPQTGELAWFNQAHHFHVGSLEPELAETLLATFAEEDLPRHAYHGDGTPITAATLDHIRACHEANATSFPWQRGDALLLDNMLVAHARTPYRGKRLIALALAELFHVPGDLGEVAVPVPGRLEGAARGGLR